MAEVPFKSTPTSDVELAPLVSASLARRLAAPPLRELAESLLAQILTENADGKAVIQGNIGNLSAGGFVNGKETLHSGNYWRPSWFSAENIAKIADPAKRARLEAQHRQMLAGQIPSAFRAYGSIAEGLETYLDLLFKQPMYAPLLKAAASGDLLAFAQEIKRHYNPEPQYDPVATAKTFASFVSRFRQKGLFDILPKAEPAGPAPPVPASSPSGSVPPRFTSRDVVTGDGVHAPLVVLRQGMTGPLVLVLARAIGAPRSYVFDLTTERYLKEYQAARGLQSDGVAGPITWAAILA